MSERRLRVALVAPPFGETAGPEVVVKNLAEELVKKGIEVTLFAPGDWKTDMEHVPTLSESLWNMKDFKKQTERVRINLILASQVKVLNYQEKFDLIHLNSQRFAYTVAANARIPVVLSFHSTIDEADFELLKKTRIFTVSITESQKRKRFETTRTIWNGVPTKNIKCDYEKEDYLVTVGRIDFGKGIDKAIKIAQKANQRLIIFGRVGFSEARQKYFHEKVEPFLNDQIVYMGQVSHEKIYDYLRKAKALLFPIQKEEAFGMVVAEALASGAPVIGSRMLPLPEILKDEKVAFLSNELDELVEAVKHTERFDRKACRLYAEKYFDSSIMADNYIELYQDILQKRIK
jgi:glycosyltransferase involved in cell wall biosynthesis